MASIPPSEPPPFRHLGSGGGQQPRSSPVLLALLALLILVALPIYLFRRPKPIGPLPFEAGARALSFDAGLLADGSASLPVDAGALKRLTLSEPKIIRCVARNGGRVSEERCDHVNALEDTLSRAIRENLACAPVSTTPFTVSYVLSIDFERNKLHLWAGRSGTLKKRSASELVRCVEHAIGQPDLSTLPHQHERYDVNVIASYPGATTSP